MIDIDVGSLYGGVSRQPPPLRFKHQVEDASNALFSVVDGFSKRPGTWFLRGVTGLGSGTDFRLHRIVRDSGERYLVVYGPSTLRVFELGGLEATVRVGTDAAAYLAANSPTSDQLRLTSEVDSTFIVNTTVPLGVVQGLTYVVTGVWSTYEVMVTSTPAANTYHQTLTATTNHAAGYWRYTGAPGGQTTLASIRFASVTGSILAHPTGFWDNSGQGPWGFKMGFQRMTLATGSYTWTVATKTLTKTDAFADFEYGNPSHVYVTGGTGVTAGWYEIASKVSNNAVTLTANIAGSDNADTTAQGIGVEVEIAYTRDTTTLASMYAIATKIQGLLEAAGVPGVLCQWTDTGSPGIPGIPGTGTLRGYFTVTSPFGGSQATITLPTTPTTGTSWVTAGWPFTAATAVVTTGSGSPQGEAATWVSVPAPDRTSEIDATKMPVRMTRTAKSRGAVPASFTVELVEWNSRDTGDNDSNPLPAPWTRGIKANDVKFWQDRFCIAAGEYVVASQAGDYFNFFLADYQNIVDSDPIVLPVSSEEITVIDFLVRYQKSLVAFTLAGKQFQIGFTDALTPSSASATLSSSYTTVAVRPKAMGERLLFVGSQGYDAQLLEYAVDDQAVAGRAENTGAHVPLYLPARPRTLEVSQNNGMALLTKAGSNSLWVYRSHWSGDQKVQSAWGTYDFDPDYLIADIAVIEDYCYMLVKNDSLWAIERFSLPQEPACVPIETVV